MGFCFMPQIDCDSVQFMCNITFWCYYWLIGLVTIVRWILKEKINEEKTKKYANKCREYTRWFFSMVIFVLIGIFIGNGYYWA